MINKIKQNNAITLIALIITIIVVRIIAGVVINMTLGNNGIINRAQSSVDLYKNAQEKEEMDLAKISNSISSYRDYSEEINLLKQEVEKLKNGANPTGTIIAFYGNNAPERISCL